MTAIQNEMNKYKLEQVKQFAKDMIKQYEADLASGQYNCIQDALKAKIDTYKIVLHLVEWDYE